MRSSYIRTAIGICCILYALSIQAQQTQPAAPNNVEVTPADKQITVTWKAPTAGGTPDGYTVHWTSADPPALSTEVTVRVGFAQQAGNTAAGFGVGESQPTGLTSHDGQLYMVGTAGNALYTLDPETGAAARVSTMNFNVEGISPQGLASHEDRLYMVSGGSGSRSFYTLNPQTGAATRFDLTVNENPTGLASHDDQLYMVGTVALALYTIDPQTGIAVLIGSADLLGRPNGLASHDGQLYMVDSFRDALHTLDPQTGIDVQIGPAEFNVGEMAPSGLASHGGQLYMTGRATDTLYRLQSLSGRYTIEGLTNGTKYTIEIVAFNEAGATTATVTAAPLPAPSTPRSVETVPNNERITVIWQAPETGGPVADYRISWTPPAGIGNATVAADVTRYTIEGLANDTEYTIEVTAVNAAGAATAAAVRATPTSLLLAPNVPQNVETVSGNETITAVWKAPDLATGGIPDGYTVRWTSTGPPALSTEINVHVGFAQQAGNTAAGFGVGEFRPSGITSHDGQLYMVGRDRDALHTLDSETGIAKQVGPRRFTVDERDPDGLASHDDRLYLVGHGRPALHTLNPKTGIAKQMGSLGFSANVREDLPSGITSHDGRLYMIGNRNDVLYILDPATGGAVRVGNVRQFNVNEWGPFGLASHDGQLYMVGAGKDALLTLNPETSRAVQVGPSNFNLDEALPTATGLASHDGQLYMVDNETAKLYRLQSLSGRYTIEGLTNGTKYTVEVAAFNEAGTTTAMAVISTPLPTPSAPVNLTAEAGDTHAVLSWDTPADSGTAPIDYYEYRVSTDGGTVWDPDWTSADDATSEVRTQIVTDLTNDTKYTFEVRAVSAAGNGTTAQITATPNSATVVFILTFDPSEYTITEDAGGGSDLNAAVTLTLKLISAGRAPQGDINVFVSTCDGSALSDKDYLPFNNMEVVFSAEAGMTELSQTVTIQIVNDVIFEPDDEVFSVVIDDVSATHSDDTVVIDRNRSEATVTIIVDDDVGPIWNLQELPNTVNESTGMNTVSIVLENESQGALVEFYTIILEVGGTATFGEDYIIQLVSVHHQGSELPFTEDNLLMRPIEIRDGPTINLINLSFLLVVTDDTTYEADETIELRLATDHPAATVNEDTTQTITLIDNDVVPDAPAELAAAAGDTHAILSWDAPADPGTSPIDHYEYRVSSDAGTIEAQEWNAAGDATSEVRTQIVTDLTNDTEYTFEVRTVSAAGNGAAAQITATPSSATAVFILMFDPTEYTVNESDGRVELTLRLTGVGRAPQDKVTVTVSTREGSAEIVEDYRPFDNAEVVFSPEVGVTESSQTVTAEIVNDNILTLDDQSFSVVITDGTAAHSDDTVVIDRGRSEATVTIFDDGVGPRWDYLQELPSTVNESTGMNTVSIRLGQGEGLFDGIYTIMLEVGGTATFGEDYIIEFVSERNTGSRTLPFTEGDRLMRPIEFMDGRDDEGSIHIRELRLRLVVTDDTVYEADETIELRLTTSHPAATVRDGDDTTQTITLIDNDTTPVLSLSVGATVIDEGASVDITVMTTATGSVYAEDQTIALEFTGDAMPEDDYTVSVDGSPLSSPYELTLSAELSSITATVTATDDRVHEADDETIEITARHGADIIGTETIAIIDDDAVPELDLSVSAVTIDEGESIDITLEITNESVFAEDQTIALEFTGDAMPEDDYTVSVDGSPLSSPYELTLPAELSSITATVTATDDRVHEADDETIEITARHGADIIGTETIAIIDDDAVPELDLSVSAVTIDEGESIDITLEITNESVFAEDQTITLEFDGTATEDDYTVSVDGSPLLPPYELTLTAGESALNAMIMALIDDMTAEGDETITLTARHGDDTIGEETITIIDNEAPVFISAASFEVEEGLIVVGMVTAEDANPQDEVMYSITGGADDALFTIDSSSGELSFTTAPNYENPADTDNVYMLTVAAIGGTGDRALTTMQVITVTVLDVPTTVTITAAEPMVTEGEPAVFVFERTDATDAPALTVNITIDDPDGVRAATANTGTPSMVTFAADSATAVLNLVTDDDTLDEADGVVTVTIIDGADYEVGIENSASVRVVDNDAVPGAPTALTATTGNGTVDLSWEAPADPGTAPIERYEYRASSDAGTIEAQEWNAAGDATGEVRTQIASSLSNDTEYTFEVRAVSAAGNGAAAQIMATPSSETAVFTLTFDPSEYTLTESDQRVTLTLRLIGEGRALQDDVTVTVSTRDGSAVTPQDYVAIENATVVFEPEEGVTELTQTVTVQIVNDIVFELDDEIFSVVINDVTAAASGDTVMIDRGEATVIIVDDGGPPIWVLDPLPSPVGESTGTVSIEMRRVSIVNSDTNRGYSLTLELGGTATFSDDYVITDIDGNPLASPPTFDVAQNQTMLEARLIITDDRVFEGEETIEIRLSTTEPKILIDDATTQTITLIDNDAVPELDLSVSAVTIDEGESIDITLEITNESVFAEDQTIALEFTGDAMPEDDYTVSVDGSPLLPPYELTLTAGESALNATIMALIDDMTAEGDETITLTARHDDDTIGEETITIIDNEAPVFISAASFEVEEGLIVVGMVTAADANPQDEVMYSITGGADDALFTIDSSSGELSFTTAPNYENPTDADGDNAYMLTVAAIGGTGDRALTTMQVITVEVLDADDSLPVITIFADEPSVTEGEVAVFVLNRTTPTDAELTVDVRVMIDDADRSGMVTFAAGSATAVFFSLSTDDDLLDEADGVVTATIIDDVGYRIGIENSASVRVVDNDAVPGAPAELAAAAGDTHAVLSWDAPADPGTAPIDHYEYRASSDAGTIEAQEWNVADDATSEIRTQIVTDLTNDTEYTFEVRAVSAAGNGAAAQVTATPSSATAVFILMFDPTEYTIAEDAGGGRGTNAAVTLTLKLSSVGRAPQDNVTVFVSTRDGSAEIFEDYVALNNEEVVFFPGAGMTELLQTVTIQIVNDIIQEHGDEIFDDEFFSVVIDDVSAAHSDDTVVIDPNRSEATVTIVNDDPSPIWSLDMLPSTVGESMDTVVPIVMRRMHHSDQGHLLTLELGGTATFGEDYVITNMQDNPFALPLTFTAPTIVGGPSDRIVTFSLVVMNDAVFEGDETIEIRLTTTHPAVFTDNTTQTITLIDNDVVPDAPAELAAAAGDTHAILSWDAPADPGTAPIDHYEYRVSSDAGTIEAQEWNAAGDATSEVRTQIVTDLTNDTEYTFEVRTVSAAGNGAAAQVTATPSSATAVFILTFNPSEYTVNESDGRVELTLRLTGVGRAPQDKVTVTVSTREGSADILEDYRPFDNAEVVFSPEVGVTELSQTVTAEIVNDNILTLDDQSFSVVITDGTAAHSDDTVVIDRGRSEATVTIVDDGVGPRWNYLQELPSTVNESTGMNTVSIRLGQGEGLFDGIYTIMLEVGGTATFEEDYIIEFVSGRDIGSRTLPFTKGDRLMRPIEFMDGRDDEGSIHIRELRLRLVVTDDTVYEADETIELRLTTSHPAATVRDGDDTTQTITLIDNDTTPVLSLSVGATVIDEGASVDITVMTTATGSVYAEDQTIALEFTGDAMPEDDYTVSVDGSPLSSPYELTLPAGASSVTATITATDDRVHEADDETIEITARHGADIIGTETIAIIDDDAVPELDLSVSAVTIDEGESIDITLEITNESVFAEDQTIALEFTGDAMPEDDYTVSVDGSPLSSPYELTLSAGASSVTATITATDDMTAEADETITITARHEGDTIGEETITITDNDADVATFTASFNPTEYTVNESDGQVELTLTLIGERPPRGNVDVTVVTSDDSAVASEDYTPRNFAIRFFGSGSSQVANTMIRIVDDMAVETEESFSVRISGVTAMHEDDMGMIGQGEATVTIVDDDDVNVAPVFSDAVSFEVNEGETVVGTMTAEDANPQDEVTYSITGGADDALFDIDSSSGELSFTTAPDYENPADADTDNVYMLIVTAAGGTDARALTTTQAITVTVLDVPTTITITAAEPMVTEGEPAVFVFERTDSTNVSELNVFFTVDDPGGVLVLPKPFALSFGAAGAASETAMLSLATIDDALEEDDSTVTVTVGAHMNYEVGIENSAEVRVVDNDVNVAPAFISAASFEVNEGETVVGTVTAADANIEDEVMYSVIGGADDALFDIDSSSGELSFTTAPDYENPVDADEDNNYMLTVVAIGGTDVRTLTTTQGITVTVLDVPTTVTITAAEPTVTEGESAVFVFERTDATDAPVLTVNITVDDPDGVLAAAAPDTITFDADSATAELSLATDDDTLEKDDSVVTVTIIDDVGYRIGIENSAEVRVVDNDVNVAPVFSSAESFEVNEGETVVGTVTAEDANIEDEVTYSVTGGADDALFAIDSSSGELSFVATPDYEDPADADTDNVYMLIVTAIGGADARALTTAQGITVTVLDVPTTITITAEDPTVTEGEPAVFTFTRTDAPALTVNITVDDSGGVLADAAPDTITFAADSATTALNLATIDDTLEEDDSTVTVTVNDGVDYVVGIENSAEVRVNDNDGPFTISFDPTEYTVNEGRTAVVMIRLSGERPRRGNVTVTVDAHDGSAVFIEDYGLRSSGLVFFPTVMLRSERFTTIDNAVVETEEIFSVRLRDVMASDPADEVVIGQGEATITIVDNDSPPIWSLDMLPSSVSESRDTAVPIVMKRMRDLLDRGYPLTLELGGTATFGEDYVITDMDDNPFALPLTFPAPYIADDVFDLRTDKTVEFRLVITDDAVFEGAETIELRLTTTDPDVTIGSDTTQTITIIDNDVPVLSLTVGATAINEGALTDIEVGITNESVYAEDQTITLEFAGDAMPEDDYTVMVGDLPLSSPYELTLPAGLSSVTATIMATDDRVDEADETITLTARHEGDTIGEETITIIDDDAAPELDLSVSETTIDEGASGDITLAITNESVFAENQTITLEFDGEATPEDDYTVMVGGSLLSSPYELTLPAGLSSVTATIMATDDQADETDEMIEITARHDGDIIGEATITIIDNDALPELDLSVSATAIDEGASVDITLEITNESVFAENQTITLEFDGEATPEDDYTVMVGGSLLSPPYELTLLAGASTAAVTIMTTDDRADEADEMIMITARHGADTIGEAMITIIDNDAAPVLFLSVSTTAIDEGESIDITLEITNESVFAEDQTIALEFTGDAMPEVDYMVSVDDSPLSSPYQLTLSAGASTAAATIMTTDDRADEADETITLTARHGADTIGEAMITIIDNDAVPELDLSVSAVTIDEGESIDITLEITNESVFAEDQTITLEFFGTATPEDDYTVSVDGSPLSSPYELTLPAGASSVTATITVTDDTEIEADEAITLTALHGADTIGKKTLTIISDVSPVERIADLTPAVLGNFTPGAVIPSEIGRYIVIPGQRNDGASIDATALLVRFNPSLRACIVNDSVASEPSYQFDCDVLSGPLAEDSTVQAPVFGSVLYWADVRDDKGLIVRATSQKIYVAPPLGFASGLQAIASDTAAADVLLLTSDDADVPSSINLDFEAGVDPVVSPSVPFEDGRGTVSINALSAEDILRLTAINGVAFSGADSDLNAVTEAMLAMHELFALGNNALRLIEAKEASINPIESVDPGLSAELIVFDQVTTITLTNDYMVDVFVYSTATAMFELAGMSEDAVRELIIDLSDNELKAADREGEEWVISLEDADFSPYIFQVMMSTNQEVTASIHALGDVADELGMIDADLTLATTGTLLTGFYAYKQADEASVGVARITSNAILNLPPLPDGREVAEVESGVFDFIAADLTGGVATVVVELSAAAQEGSRYYKYQPDDGWTEFNTSSNDKIYSAPAPCPSAQASRESDAGGGLSDYAWRLVSDGVRADDECLLLEIEDGSVNDSDGRVNGIIFDPGALVQFVARVGGGGGGAVGLWWLLLFVGIILAAMVLKRRNARPTRRISP